MCFLVLLGKKQVCTAVNGQLMKGVKAGLEGATHQSAQNLKVIGSLASFFVASEGSGEADIVVRIVVRLVTGNFVFISWL